MGLRELINPIRERLVNVVIFQTEIPSSTYDALMQDAKSFGTSFAGYTMNHLFPPMLRVRQLVLDGWRSVPVYDLTNGEIKQLFKSGDNTEDNDSKPNTVRVQFAMRVSDYKTFLQLSKQIYPNENEKSGQYQMLFNLVSKWMHHRAVLVAPGSVFYTKGNQRLLFPQLDLK